MAKAPKKTGSDDTALVKALADILDEAGLAELEYETADLSVRLSRVSGAAPVAPVAMAASPVAAPVPAPAAASPAAATETADAASHPGAVTSPMVGTVYVAPEPEAPNFISVGDKVKKGQTILIVEAMKVMNEIHSELKGTITEILVENGDAIEFGQPLFKIKTT